MQKIICEHCGGSLKEQGRIYICENCGTKWEKNTADDVMNKLEETLAAMKQEQLAGARSALYNATHKEFLDSEEIKDAARRVKELYPDDFYAEFYETTSGDNHRNVNALLERISDKAYKERINVVLGFLFKVMEPENFLAIGKLLEKVYDGAEYERIQTEFERRAEEIESDIFDVGLPRDVFVAYRSTDMKKVNELVEYLEERGLSCFVSARNLRHGRNAARIYDDRLEKAMDSCTAIVLVSSLKSRTEGDAWNKELPYIKKRDLERKPEYASRNDYIGLPKIYKKPRVEYLIEEYKRYAREMRVKEFFSGYQWQKTVEGVYDAVCEIINTSTDEQLLVEAKTGAGKRADNNFEDIKLRASEGDAEAQYKLAVCYRDGEFVTQSDKSAFEWFERSATKGNKLAMNCMGECYLHGKGVECNLDLAQIWYRKAGNNKAADYVKQRIKDEIKTKKEEEKKGKRYKRKENAGRAAECIRRFFKRIGAGIMCAAKYSGIGIWYAIKYTGIGIWRAVKYSGKGIRDAIKYADMSEILAILLIILLNLANLALAIFGILGATMYNTICLKLQKIGFYVGIAVFIIDVCAIFIWDSEFRFKFSTIALACLLAGVGIYTFFGGNLNVKDFYIDEQEIVYAVNDTGYVLWKMPKGHDTITVKQEVNGIPVREIGKKAAKNNKSIKTLIFESKKISIGEKAFMGCGNLAQVMFADDSVYEIGAEAFKNSAGLKTVDLGDKSSYTISGDVFYGCLSLELFNVRSSSVVSNKTQDRMCTTCIFGGATNAEIKIEGGSISYLADNVKKLTVEKNSEALFSLAPSYSVKDFVQIDQAVFADGFDFPGSNVSNSLIKHKFFTEPEIIYCPYADIIYLPSSITFIPDNFFGDVGDGCRVYFGGTEEQWNKLSIGNYGNGNYIAGKVKMTFEAIYGAP